MASGTKITEIERTLSLAGVNDVYVKKGDAFYRIHWIAIY